MDLPDREIDAAVGQAGEPDLAVRVMAAEILQPIIVDVQNFVRGLVVVQLGCGTEDPVDDLSVDAVRLHVFEAQMRVAAADLAFFGVLIEAALRHDVDADILPGYVLGTTWADAVEEAEIGAVLGDPLRP